MSLFDGSDWPAGTSVLQLHVISRPTLVWDAQEGSGERPTLVLRKDIPGPHPLHVYRVEVYRVVEAGGRDLL